MSKTVKNEKQALVPKLRFPEFQDAGDWEIKPFGKLFTIGNGRDHKHLSSGDIPVYGSGGYMRSVNDFLYNGESVCIGRKGTIDNPVFLSGKFWTVDTLFYTRSFKGCLPRFIFSLFQNIDWHKHNEAGGVPSLSKTNISKIEVAIPTVSEQQKIDDCLSSLDALIAAQAEKIDALKTHKKGLMQQLFPREGETVPRLRFPEFLDAGKWKEVALGEIAEIKLGKMLDSKKHMTGNLLSYLNNLSVRWNDVDTSNLPKMYFDLDELDRFGLRAGDVVVWEGGEPGRSAVWDGHLPDIKFQKAIHRVRFNVPFEPRLLVIYLESIAGTSQLEKLFTGGGIKHLTRETFAQLRVPFISHAEQQKIVDCLSSLDALIAAQTEKLNALKAHKKGLMQQLFPSPEVAGA